MSDFRLDVHRPAIDKLPNHPGVKNLLADLAKEVVEEAKRNAPRLSGRGSDSIDFEFVGSEIHISWSTRYPYMKYQELGTRRMKSHPFLAKAARRKYQTRR